MVHRQGIACLADLSMLHAVLSCRLGSAGLLVTLLLLSNSIGPLRFSEFPLLI